MNKKPGALQSFSSMKLFCFSFFLFILITSNAFSKTYNGHPRTIAHDFLDMEKGVGAGERHYLYIDSLINRAIARITVKKTYSTDEAIRILLTIDYLLRGEGFRFENNLLLSKGIDSKIIDCDNYCTLYTAISEVLKLPIIPVYAPNHSFIRFNFKDGSYLNWECTEGRHYSNAYYINRLKIPKKSIDKGVYLKSLSRKEFLAVQSNNIGAYLMSRRNFNSAIPYFNSAIEVYPNFSSAYHNRGTALYAIKQSKDAFIDLNTAMGFDPSRASTHNSLGDIFFDLREYSKAMEHYTISIKLDPGNYVPYHSIGLIFKHQGFDKKSSKWLKKSVEIKKKFNK